MEDGTLNIFGSSIVLTWQAKQLLLSAFIGLLIGLEREWRGKAASIRTFSTICAGSCLFTILSLEAAGTSVSGQPYDVTRISTQIVTGIGFLGGGVIFKTSDRIEGITTGALIWLTAAVGMACGFNKTYLVAVTVIVALLIHIAGFIIYETLDFIRPNGAAKNAK